MASWYELWLCVRPVVTILHYNYCLCCVQLSLECGGHTCELLVCLLVTVCPIVNHSQLMDHISITVRMLTTLEGNCLSM